MKFRGSTRRPREAAGPGYRHWPPLGPSCLHLDPSLLAAHSELLSPWRWGGGEVADVRRAERELLPTGYLYKRSWGGRARRWFTHSWGWRRGLWDERLWANPRRSLKQCCGSSPAVSGMLAWSLHSGEFPEKRFLKTNRTRCVTVQ